MAKVSTSISLDVEVKDRAQSILGELGLDLSTAVGLFLRQTIREKRIPFEVSLNVPAEVTVNHKEKVEAVRSSIPRTH